MTDGAGAPEVSPAGEALVERGSRTRLAPPSREEVAAILAAVELAWPRPGGDPEPEPAPSRWRFSGRWWSAPIPLRRVRPF